MRRAGKALVLARRWLAELALRPSFALVACTCVAAALAVLAILRPVSTLLDAEVASPATARALTIVVAGGREAVSSSQLVQALGARREVGRLLYAPSREEALASGARPDAVLVLPERPGGPVRLLVARGMLGPLAVSSVRAALASADPAERRDRLASGGVEAGGLSVEDDLGAWGSSPLLVDAVLLFLVPLAALFPPLALAVLATSLLREEFRGQTIDGLLMASPEPRDVAAGLAAPSALLSVACTGLVLALAARAFPLSGAPALLALSAASCLLLCGVGAAAAVRSRGSEAAQASLAAAGALLLASAALPRPLSPPRLAAALGAGPVAEWEPALCVALLLALAAAAWADFAGSFSRLGEG